MSLTFFREEGASTNAVHLFLSRSWEKQQPCPSTFQQSTTSCYDNWVSCVYAHGQICTCEDWPKVEWKKTEWGMLLWNIHCCFPFSFSAFSLFLSFSFSLSSSPSLSLSLLLLSTIFFYWWGDSHVEIIKGNKTWKVFLLFSLNLNIINKNFPQNVYQLNFSEELWNKNTNNK